MATSVRFFIGLRRRTIVLECFVGKLDRCSALDASTQNAPLHGDLGEGSLHV